MDNAASVTTALDASKAQQLARSFSIVFNGAILYGATHPSTLKNCQPLYSCLSSIFTTLTEISMIFERDSFFIEDICVDKIVNPRRIVARFAKSGLSSVTFDNSVRLQDTEEFFRLTSDNQAVYPIDQIMHMFEKGNFRGIKFNFIHFGRIRKDQNISSATTPLPENTISGIRKESDVFVQSTFTELEKILTLKNMLESPQDASSAFINAIQDPSLFLKTAEQLGNLRQSIHSENITSQSIENLLNAVYELKVDLLEAIQIQKETGKFLSTMEPVQEEFELLTADVVIRLIKEEYNHGQIEIRRLAKIIRRMLPEPRELKKFLPMLKKALLAEGMSLGDYLQLIKDLNFEIEDETVAEALRKAALESGITAKDLASTILTDPSESARLMLLAAELKNGHYGDEQALSDILADFVEKSTCTALKSSHAGANCDNGKFLRSAFSKLQSQIVENLGKNGLSNDTLDKIRTKLQGRFEKQYDELTSHYMLSIVSSEQGQTPLAEIAKILENLIDKKAQLDGIRNPLSEALFNKGYTRQQIDEFMQKTASGMSQKEKTSSQMGLLSANNLLYFLSREIKTHKRYATPLSTLALTFEPSSPPISSQKLLMTLKELLRDIDLVGPFEKLGPSGYLIVLSMTDQQGAHVVRQRILDSFSDSRSLVPIVSVTVPTENQCELSLFLQDVLQNHASETLTHQPLLPSKTP